MSAEALPGGLRTREALAVRRDIAKNGGGKPKMLYFPQRNSDAERCCNTLGVSQGVRSMTAPQYTPTRDLSQEEWRPVVGFEGLYDVSSYGRLRRMAHGKGTFAGRLLHPRMPARGKYIVVRLYGPNKTRRDVAVHILVAEAFVGPIPRGYEVNHEDGNKLNNFCGNLKIVTKQANMEHARAMGLMHSGERHYAAVLTDDAVRTIRTLSAEGVKHSTLAERFGISRSHVYDVARGRRWKHVA